MKEKKIKVLQDALKVREDEFFSYQIDIDNFERAIKKLEKEDALSVDMQEFKENLKNLLEQNKQQQNKCSIIKDVIKEQLFELTEDPCFM